MGCLSRQEGTFNGTEADAEDAMRTFFCGEDKAMESSLIKCAPNNTK